MSGARARQLTITFPSRRAHGRADFLVTPANEHAAAFVLALERWPGGRLALTGPDGSGKTHLAHALMAERSARLIDAAGLRPDGVEELAAAPAAVVEDVDRLGDLSTDEARQAEAGVFHLFNLAAAGQARLLVTGREAPARWRIRTPDLASRLQSLTVAKISAPDDALLSSLVVKHGHERRLDFDADAAAFVASRVERSFAGVAQAVAQIDAAASLRKRRHVTLSLASAALRDAAATESTEE
ncbi:MAG: DnaA/Hda family protein [Pseudomonadota bacterium]